jgi:hypothetical protein
MERCDLTTENTEITEMASARVLFSVISVFSVVKESES